MSFLLRSKSVTQDKLAAMPVGATADIGGMALSTFATFASASSTFVSVTGFSVTLTTSGRPVFVGLSPTSATQSIVALDFGNDGYVQFHDGTNVFGLQRMTSPGSSNLFLPPSAFHAIFQGVAGTYTFTVQVKTSSGGSITLWGSLLAYEL